MSQHWSTPIGEYDLADSQALNAELTQHILALYEAKSLRGQGENYPLITHVFETDRFAAIDIRPALGDVLLQFLCAAVTDYLRSVREGDYTVRPEHFSSIWPNVNQRGEWHRPHRHSALEHIVVGTYYASVPSFSSPDEGSLNLMDPRVALGGSNEYGKFYNTGEIRVRPEEGYLVLFPPHICHYVTPHTHDAPRVSISFNVSIDVLKRGDVVLGDRSSNSIGARI